MIHENEIPFFEAPDHCIGCSQKLSDWIMERNKCLCIPCENKFMAEHSGIIITNYGVDELRVIQHKQMSYESNKRNKEKKDFDSQNSFHRALSKSSESNNHQKNSSQSY